LIKFILVLCLVLLLTACTPGAIHLRIASSHYLNPDEQGRSLSVVIKVYQLTNIDAFQSATFWQLWRNPHQTLGKSFLRSDVFSIHPSQTTKVIIQRKKQANYLGVIAIFRRPGNRSWRSYVKLPMVKPLLPIKVHLSIMGRHLSLER